MKCPPLEAVLRFVAWIPLLVEPGLCLERLVPFDKVYVSVETGRPAARSASKLRVSVQMHRGSEDVRDSTSIDIDCYDFSADQRMMPEADLQAFLDAGAAAAAGANMRKEVVTETFRGEVNTIYETADGGSGKIIRVTRGKDSAAFESTEAERVREAVAEAKIGRAWYEKILVAKVLPEATPEARPPRSEDYYLDSQVGEVSGRGISYEVTVSHHGMGGDSEYRISHGLLFYRDGRMTGSTSGEWVKGLLQKISMALDAAKNGRQYTFKSGEDDGQRYVVTANQETREADIVLAPGRFFDRGEPIKAHFGLAQLEEIRRIIDRSDEHRKWFGANEGLFFTPIRGAE